MNCLNPKVLLWDGQTGEVLRAVPCNKCDTCLIRKKRQKVFLLGQEHKRSAYSYFVTLTYSEDYIEEPNKKTIQLWIKRIRKKFSIRYFCVSEHGELNQRPHYHALIFSKEKMRYKDFKAYWLFGRITATGVNTRRIRYCCQYTLKKNGQNKDDRDFVLASRKPPIGASYLSSAKRKYHSDTRTPFYKDNQFYVPMTRRDQRLCFPDGLPETTYVQSALPSPLTPFAKKPRPLH